jgi:AhpD family alkylhydroperoxidase
VSQRMDVFEVVPDASAAVWALENYVADHIDHRVGELIKLRASILNGCSRCVDLHTRTALKNGESQRRLFAVAAWREAPFFDERERAALALTDAVTRLGEHGVPDDVWDEVRAVWSEEETANLILAIATINVWNRISVTTRRQPLP